MGGHDGRDKRSSESRIVFSDDLLLYGNYIAVFIRPYIFHFRLNTALRGSP